MDGSVNTELYKIVVDTISQNESKRLQANSTYLGIVVALATVSASVRDINLNVILLLCLVVSLIWFLTIKFHRDLAKAKFEVLGKLEDGMVIRPFAEEWKIYKSHKYKLTLTQIELVVPVCIGTMALFWLIVNLVSQS